MNDYFHLASRLCRLPGAPALPLVACYELMQKAIKEGFSIWGVSIWGQTRLEKNGCQAKINSSLTPIIFEDLLAVTVDYALACFRPIAKDNRRDSYFIPALFKYFRGKE